MQKCYLNCSNLFLYEYHRLCLLFVFLCAYNTSDCMCLWNYRQRILKTVTVWSKLFLFVINLTAPVVNATSTCPNKTVELTTIDGIIQSNKRGEWYENSMDCQWNITSNAWVELTFDGFDTEYLDDYLTVYDGTSLSSPVIGEFSGSKRPLPLVSSANNLYVRFTTDAAQNKQYKGFRAKYRGRMRCNLMEKYICLKQLSTFYDD